jgi:hypothetical protein
VSADIEELEDEEQQLGGQRRGSLAVLILRANVFTRLCKRAGSIRGGAAISLVPKGNAKSSARFPTVR